MSDSDDDSAAKTAFDSADPPRNFTLSINERVRALTIGPPAYATRKKSIEDLEERHVRTLVALRDGLVASRDQDVRLALHELDDEAIARAMLDKASTFDLKKLNALIAAHNRYYPIEANLPIDLRTGEYLVYGQRWLPDEPWTAHRLVERARAIIAAR